MPSDSFKTLQKPSQAEIKVLGSRFLGFAHPVASKEDALAVWKGYQKEFFDATHHCFAYRLGPEGVEFRYNDDGEPSGTAGRPILAVIDHHGVTDTLVVVVRYFGGTKLGVGGLVRAYGDAAEAALAAATPETRFQLERFRIGFDHALTQPVMHAIGVAGAKIAGSAYDEDAHLVLEIRASKADALRSSLVEATSGKVRFETEAPEAGSGDPGVPASDT